MTKDHLAVKLQRAAMKMNADLIGFADPACFLDKIYTGNRPQDIMPDIGSVLILGLGVPRGAFETLPKGRAQYTNTLMAATATLRIIAFQLARIIEKQGYKASIVPTEGSEFGYWYADRQTLKADISIKYAAYHAGMGNFGLNHLLITKEFGARVRMNAILTDAILFDKSQHASSPSLTFINEKCDSCMRCIEACPVGAISKDGTIDKHKCATYMFTTLGGLRCGLCVQACPT